MTAFVTPCDQSLDENALVLRAKAGDQDAFAELLRRHRPLTLAIAARFAGPGFVMEDLASVALEGFVRSFPRYQPGTQSLSKFWRARGRYAVIDHYRSRMGFPRRDVALVRAYRDAVDDERARSGRDFVDLAVFARRHKIPLRRAQLVALSAPGTVPFDHFGLEPGAASPELSVADSAPTPAESADAHSVVEQVMGALASLKPNERRVVQLRLGLPPAKRALSFAEIAPRMGVTGSRVQQVHEKALRKIRRAVTRLRRLEAGT